MDKKTLTERVGVLQALLTRELKTGQRLGGKSYTESDSGSPVLFLHGNSDRVVEYPAELWKEEARQTIALLEHLKLEKMNLVGTSGGACIVVNVALERPELVARVVSDSFDRRTLSDDFSINLNTERVSAKKDEMGILFYQWCQGEDWELIVDMDAKALLQCANEKLPLFAKPLGGERFIYILRGCYRHEAGGTFFILQSLLAGYGTVTANKYNELIKLKTNRRKKI